MVLAVGVGCQGRFGQTPYQRIAIDTTTRQIVLLDHLWRTPGPGSRYYTSTRDFSNRAIVTDVRSHPGSDSLTEWLDTFWCDTVLRLEYREKVQVLWPGTDQSPPILARTRFYYGPAYVRSPTDFETMASRQFPLSERPIVSATPPVPVQSLTLDNVSVVRALAGPGSVVVASANYSATGVLQALRYGGSDSTTTAPTSDSGPSFSIGSNFLDDTTFRTVFGLLHDFPVAAYLGGRASPWVRMGKGTGVPAVLELVNFHYARNAIVRQDVFDPTGHASTRWLSFAVTREDSLLAPLDAARPFGYRYIPGGTRGTAP